MGAEASKPQQGAKFQVIGAGLSRTGTASFSEALRILLNGPVYHCGTQETRGDGQSVQTWLKILPLYPISNEADHKTTLSVLGKELDGYVAMTDGPGNLYVKELMEMYPQAVVICTTRDPKPWAASLQKVADKTTLWYLNIVLWPIGSMRHFVKFVRAVEDAYDPLLGRDITPEAYQTHVDWLKKTVPREKLFFFDVKEGWEPLCKFLGKEVPEGIPFPRINDGQAIEKRAKELIVTGLSRWLGIFVVLGLMMFFLLRR
jgi:hypothetical protein